MVQTQNIPVMILFALTHSLLFFARLFFLSSTEAHPHWVSAGKSKYRRNMRWFGGLSTFAPTLSLHSGYPARTNRSVEERIFLSISLTLNQSGYPARTNRSVEERISFIYQLNPSPKRISSTHEPICGREDFFIYQLNSSPKRLDARMSSCSPKSGC